MVKLAGYEDRRPSQLSGGQRQRVALARALVNGPKVLLLDEPLGALDLKLREQMQEELKALQKKLGITFVFVTHDQGEALSMADRVAIFNDGKIVQVDVSRRYLRAARGRASSPTSSGHRTCFRPPSPPATAEPPNGRASGPRRSASSRRAAPCREAHAHADGEIKMISYQGAVTRFSVETEKLRICAEVPADGTWFKQGDKVRLIWPKVGHGHHGGRRVSQAATADR